ncbi:hypothetical protein NBH00_20940 [Paraconexibacter antarcticus]|uniref:Uncharacterized protein n=1 Tax=Paraconexibacter antarcticus TaxID=2949664 RepID=A0ABY5DSJ9_9ACTN|nr:hypothetical protein [Paraconexibacter antarcticus]UTI63797.1 hypothetical protein NBH00_20940 [Paraconexibacter antarcticus]
MRRVGVVLTCLAVVVLGATARVASADPGDQVVTLRSTFEKQHATASFTVPANWAIRARSSSATLTAPSSRGGCSHVITADLNALYVAPTTTSMAWVRSRLSDKGRLVAAFPGLLSWGAASVPGSRTADGVAAQITGSGRYGPIMTEVRLEGTLVRGCPANQGPKLAKRLARMLPGVGITASRR